MDDNPLVVSTKQTDVIVGYVHGGHTQVIHMTFGSHTLVLVSQLGNMGIHISLEPSTMSSNGSEPMSAPKAFQGNMSTLIPSMSLQKTW